ncbi:MAG: tetratricopeptide repeat protein [Ignavibacteriales bacterium]|nr:tetratricopeptide repeat protein [Ignavibacteriales bacterium]
MMCLRAKVLFLVTIPWASFASAAQTPTNVFASGNEHYRSGRFAEAIADYESLLKQGYASAPLHFNLGNAYYRTGDLARAILAYERAQRLEPGDPDISFNLRLANLRIVDRIDAVPELFLVRWFRSLAEAIPVSATVWILLSAWVLLFVVLSLPNILDRFPFERPARILALAAIIVVIVSAGLLGLQVYEASSRTDAIILDAVVTAKASPDDQSVDTFVIHGGLKVDLGDSVGEWVRITLADGKVGWIRSSSCERI